MFYYFSFLCVLYVSVSRGIYLAIIDSDLAILESDLATLEG